MDLINIKLLQQQLTQWLDEDIGFGDVTTMATIPEQHVSKGIIHAKQNGVVAGLPIAAAVFDVVDPQLVFTFHKQDGQVVETGEVLAEITGRTRSILTGERLALNLLQRLSGIATVTKSMVEATAGHSVRIVDTRKTTPGHRQLEKYAVKVGGGANHRFGLFDAVMIKDNHIKGAGGIRQAIQAARSQIPHTMKIEVEVENDAQVQEALEAQADIIMLDNMDVAQMKAAVNTIRQHSPHIVIEASGNVSLETVGQIAATGVDVISSGRLTYSVPALDISLDLNERKGD